MSKPIFAESILHIVAFQSFLLFKKGFSIGDYVDIFRKPTETAMQPDSRSKITAHCPRSGAWRSRPQVVI